MKHTMIAHITRDGDVERIQSVKEHTLGVKKLSVEEGSKIGIDAIVKLSAIFHDLGKEKSDFQEYILHNSNTENEKIAKGSVNHSSAGAHYFYQRFHKEKNKENQCQNYLSEIISYAIAAHHGLFDNVEISGNDKFSARLKEPELYEEACGHFQKDVLEHYDLDELFHEASKQFLSVYRKIQSIYKSIVELNKKSVNKALSMNKPSQEAYSKFLFGCFQRMVLSILIDSDWIDTAQFMNGIQQEDEYPKDLLLIAQNQYNHYMKQIQDKFQKKDTTEKEKKIYRLRNEIQIECISFGAKEAGIYSLPIPTGGGKTLSGLGYALEYCKEHKEVERIIYVSPFISITEQNAQVIKDAVGFRDWVLEHHSNVIEEKASDNNGADEKNASLDINWDEPFICTTMVQLFNTLFSQRKQSIRRFHRLKNAVIIIDEVQSIPIKCIHTFNLMMNFLNKVCNTNIILCTATQPLLGQVLRPIIYSNPQNMITDITKRFEEFERVEIVTDITNNGCSFEQMKDKVMEQFKEHESILVILNSKYAVKSLYDEVKSNSNFEGDIIYLTTNLCPQHRIDKIRMIKESLEHKDRKILIISTNLIEAGVDLSVECVFRSLAGLDRIAQAAGRCNRNGELKKGKVIVVKLEDEHISKMTELKHAQESAEKIFINYTKSESTDSLLAPKWMNLYYKDYFFQSMKEMDFNCREDGVSFTIFNILSKGFSLSEEAKVSANYSMGQAYETAGKHYQLIEDGEQVGIIVPYENEGKEYISQLESIRDVKALRSILRKAQRYTVSAFRYGMKELIECNAIRECKNIPNIYFACNYDNDLGITNKLDHLIF